MSRAGWLRIAIWACVCATFGQAGSGGDLVSSAMATGCYLSEAGTLCSGFGKCVPRPEIGNYSCQCAIFRYEPGGAPSSSVAYPSCALYLWDVDRDTGRVLNGVMAIVVVVFILSSGTLYLWKSYRSHGNEMPSNTAVRAVACVMLYCLLILLSYALIPLFDAIPAPHDDEFSFELILSRFFLAYLPLLPLLTAYTMLFLFWRGVTTRTLEPQDDAGRSRRKHGSSRRQQGNTRVDRVLGLSATSQRVMGLCVACMLLVSIVAATASIENGFLIFNIACMVYTFGFGITFLVWGWRVRSSLSAFSEKLAQSEPVPEKLHLPGVTQTRAIEVSASPGAVPAPPNNTQHSQLQAPARPRGISESAKPGEGSAPPSGGGAEGKQELSQFSSERSGAKTNTALLTRQERKLFELQQKQYREQLAKLARARRVTYMAMCGSCLALLETTVFALMTSIGPHLPAVHFYVLYFIYQLISAAWAGVIVFTFSGRKVEAQNPRSGDAWHADRVQRQRNMRKEREEQAGFEDPAVPFQVRLARKLKQYDNLQKGKENREFSESDDVELGSAKPPRRDAPRNAHGENAGKESNATAACAAVNGANGAGTTAAARRAQLIYGDSDGLEFDYGDIFRDRRELAQQIEMNQAEIKAGRLGVGYSTDRDGNPETVLIHGEPPGMQPLYHGAERQFRRAFPIHAVAEHSGENSRGAGADSSRSPDGRSDRRAADRPRRGSAGGRLNHHSNNDGSPLSPSSGDRDVRNRRLPRDDDQAGLSWQQRLALQLKQQSQSSQFLVQIQARQQQALQQHAVQQGVEMERLRRQQPLVANASSASGALAPGQSSDARDHHRITIAPHHSSQHQHAHAHQSSSHQQQQQHNQHAGAGAGAAAGAGDVDDSWSLRHPLTNQEFAPGVLMIPPDLDAAVNGLESRMDEIRQSHLHHQRTRHLDAMLLPGATLPFRPPAHQNPYNNNNSGASNLNNASHITANNVTLSVVSGANGSSGEKRSGVGGRQSRHSRSSDRESTDSAATHRSQATASAVMVHVAPTAGQATSRAPASASASNAAPISSAPVAAPLAASRPAPLSTSTPSLPPHHLPPIQTSTDSKAAPATALPLPAALPPIAERSPSQQTERTDVLPPLSVLPPAPVAAAAKPAVAANQRATDSVAPTSDPPGGAGLPAPAAPQPAAPVTLTRQLITNLSSGILSEVASPNSEGSNGDRPSFSQSQLVIPASFLLHRDSQTGRLYFVMQESPETQSGPAVAAGSSLPAVSSPSALASPSIARAAAYALDSALPASISLVRPALSLPLAVPHASAPSPGHALLSAQSHPPVLTVNTSEDSSAVHIPVHARTGVSSPLSRSVQVPTLTTFAELDG